MLDFLVLSNSGSSSNSSRTLEIRRPGIVGIINKEVVDDMILDLRSLKDIAKVGDVSSQTIINYLVRIGLYKDWKRERTRLVTASNVESRSGAQEFVNFLVKREYELALETDWPYAKALDYDLSRSKRGRSDSIPFDKLLKLFVSYRKTFLEGRKLSLKNLEKESDVYFVTVGRIFKRVGLKPFYGNRKIKKTPKNLKPKIKRAASLDISCADAAYFLGIHHSVVYNAWKSDGVVKGKTEYIILGPHGILNYSLASKIYEDVDTGFDKSEVMERQNISSTLYDTALRKRSELSMRIVEILDKLDAGVKHTRPYYY